MAVQRHIPLFAAALAMTVLSAPMAHAGKIESACKQSGRPVAGPQVCHCIQQVADRMLTSSDQKLAATFFKDPHRAQEIRMSDKRRDETFWDRYIRFGNAAARSCS
ncbi:MAG: hypothetical protein KDA50_05575 [Rhodobacteraceae bacterium]|nr:hypothetical protein [Paracoccaceae bacterium]